MQDGVKMLQVPLWRSYLAGCILLGIAPCTAMVLVWGYLAKGNDGLTLVMVAINSLSMLLLYGLLGGFLLGVGKLPVPGRPCCCPSPFMWPCRWWPDISPANGSSLAKGPAWFQEKFLHVLTPITIIALLITLVLLFCFKGEIILANPADHPLDRDSAVHPDQPDFLDRVLAGQGAEIAVCRMRPRRP